MASGRLIDKERGWKPRLHYGICDLTMQRFNVSTRTASAHDVMIDCIGAFAAVLLCWIFERRNPAYQASIK